MFENTDKVEDDKVEDNKFAELVGEDKKYKTMEDALNSIVPAQEHIKKLEEELATLRENAKGAKTGEEMLEELRAELAKAVKPEVKTQTSEVVETSPTEKDDKVDQLDISSLISKTLDEREKEKQVTENQNYVVQQALVAWGSEAKDKLYATALQNGYTEEMINTLASQSPSAALHAVGLKAQNKPTPMSNNLTGFRTSGESYNKVEAPAKPKNWGNDAEVAEYMQKLHDYKKQKGNN